MVKYYYKRIEPELPKESGGPLILADCLFRFKPAFYVKPQKCYQQMATLLLFVSYWFLNLPFQKFALKMMSSI